jgi:hypothetical protein
MTPKEKAEELVDNFGKQLATKVVDYILKSNPCSEGSDRGGNFMWVEDIYYWLEVKKELEKI